MNIRLSGSERKQLASAMQSAIADASVKMFEEEPRAHLGASEIGAKCSRSILYKFRWMHFAKPDGRMYRLFNRGHLEEKRIVAFLRATGCAVYEVNPDTGKQFRIGYGHFGGSLDGVLHLPEGWPDLWFLLEMKTHNQKSFDGLLKLGVKQSKPEHFTQMCVYGFWKKLQYAIYFAVCKNTDEVYIEIVELDWNAGEAQSIRAQNIIDATKLPGKIAATSAYWECKFCDNCGICHNNEPIEKNCRSCMFSRPLVRGEPPIWFCTQFQMDIPEGFIPKGCERWKAFE